MLKHLSLISAFVAAMLLNAVTSTNVEGTPANRRINNMPIASIHSLPPPNEPPPTTTNETESSQPQAEPNTLFIFLTSCHILGDKVVVQFGLPMGELYDMDEHPEVTFTPTQEGTFKWRSPTELVFSSTKNNMNWGEDTSISLKPAIPFARQEAEPNTLDISLTSCRPTYNEVVIQFSLPMVEPDALAIAEPPEVILTPAQEGTFEWRSPTELVFRPTKDNMNWGETIAISLPQAVPLAGQEFALNK